MFGTRWRLFWLLGIPIAIDASWLVIVALLTLSLSSVFPSLLHQYFPGVPHALPLYEFWIMGLIAALGFFLCILLHELGHAVVARSLGIPIRGITLFLFGGVAELVDEPESAASEFLMAVAGPIVSVALAALLALLAWLGYRGDWPDPVVIVLGCLAFINVLVLLFNLVPAFPLDGGRVLRSILWAVTGNLLWATRWAALLGQGFAWLLIAWAILRLFTGNWLGGVWLGLIAWFLYGAAKNSYRELLIKEALRGESVSHFMTLDVPTVPPWLDLRHWVEDYVYPQHLRLFPVVSNGHLEGFITTDLLTGIPRGEWKDHTVREVMRHDLRAITISSNADALQAFAKMQRSGTSRLLVTEGDYLLGLVSHSDLLRFLGLKLELQGTEQDRGSPWENEWEESAGLWTRRR